MPIGMARAAAALVVVLVGLSVYLYTQVTDLQSRVSNYQMQNAQLEAQIRQLDANYWRLQEEQNALKDTYYELLRSYDELKAQNVQMRNLLDLYEKVPQGYYSSGTYSHHGNTLGELKYFLTWEFTLPRGHTPGVFDCSEASAYLEWALENAEFDACIAVGPTPFAPGSGYHAWVLAYTGDNYRIAIEATALTGENRFSNLFMLRVPGEVYWEDPFIPYWRNYYEGYDNVFRNIYEAVRVYGSVQEWNWWEGFWVLP